MLSPVLGVGQDEEPLALVGRSGVGCSDTNPFRIEPERGKVGEHAVEAPRTERRDVLDEDKAGSYLRDDSRVFAPQARALAVEASTLSSNADVLTGESPTDAIHDATPWAAVEGSNVVPDRRRIQLFLFHPGHEAGRCVCFPLDVTNSPEGRHGQLETVSEPAAASEEFECAAGMNSDGMNSQAMRAHLGKTFRGASRPTK
nr:hypothetical protein [Myxococcus llanfairpwllgwyngyllgogerychwyrndrobwllllantysiliogogogochensis]